MKVEFVNPFINGLLNTLSMMAQTELRAGKPKLKDDAVARGDVSGVIGMVGAQMQGSLSITFEENLALHVMEKTILLIIKLTVQESFCHSIVILGEHLLRFASTNN